MFGEPWAGKYAALVWKYSKEVRTASNFMDPELNSESEFYW